MKRRGRQKPEYSSSLNYPRCYANLPLIRDFPARHPTYAPETTRGIVHFLFLREQTRVLEAKKPEEYDSTLPISRAILIYPNARKGPDKAVQGLREG